MLKTVGTIEMGTGLWRYPNVGATNLIGWNAFPNSSGDQTAYYLDYNDNNVNSDDGFIISSQHNGYNDGPVYFYLFPELINLPQPYYKMAFIRCIKE